MIARATAGDGRAFGIPAMGVGLDAVDAGGYAHPLVDTSQMASPEGEPFEGAVSAVDTIGIGQAIAEIDD